MRRGIFHFICVLKGSQMKNWLDSDVSVTFPSFSSRYKCLTQEREHYVFCDVTRSKKY